MSLVHGRDRMTPIHEIHVEGNRNHIYLKREDLLPFSFGGNKVRIAKKFFEDMEATGKDCMVGYGNARSNLSRALANICCSGGGRMPYHLTSR